MTTDTSRADRAQQAASTATDEGKHMAGVAAEEVKSVAAEAKDQVRGLAAQTMGDVQGQVEDQTRQQKERLAGTLATFGSDLGSMAENVSGLAADAAHELADRARALSEHLEGREPRELLDDVRRFARHRPGTFLLGALAAGIVAGRLARSTKDAATVADAGLGTPSPAVPEIAPATQSTQPPAQTSEPFAAPTVTPAAAMDEPFAGPTV